MKAAPATECMVSVSRWLQPRRSRYSFRQRSVEMADESLPSTVRRWYSRKASELAWGQHLKTQGLGSYMQPCLCMSQQSASLFRP